jgi:hypothetical protein
MSEPRKKPSGWQNELRRRQRRAAEREAEDQRRADAAARGEPVPATRYAELLARRPRQALGLAAWTAEVLGEAVAELLADDQISTDDRRRWLVAITRSFAAVAPKGALEAQLQKLERQARLAPPDAAAEMDRDPAAKAEKKSFEPAEPAATGTGELTPDPEAAS